MAFPIIIPIFVNLNFKTMRNFLKKNQEPYFSETLVIFVSFREIGKWLITGTFRKSLIIGTLLLFISAYNTSPATNMAMASITQKSESEKYVDDLKTQMKTLLVREVEAYIKKQVPESKLTPQYLVDKCLEYDTDIIFVLAQGMLESHFGTRGTAARTHSVWNVGAYDNQKPRNWYDHPDESLEPYLKLVNEKYLINITTEGDTIYKDLYHLVQDKGYINYNGSRFASARGYENGMRKFMIRIDMETSIGFYQDILKLSDAKIIAHFKPSENMGFADFMALN